MASTPLLKIPYPERNAEPFYEAFVAMVEALDRMLTGAKEDRNLILGGGGRITWQLAPGGASGELAWSAPLEVYTPTTGLLETIPAGSVQIQEGQVAYVRVIRQPQTSPTLAPLVASRIDLDAGQGDPYVLGIRRGDRVFLRTGHSLGDGEALDNLAPPGELAGDVVGPFTRSVVNRVRGGYVPPNQQGAALTMGAALSVVPGADPRLILINAGERWVTRSGCEDVVVRISGGNYYIIRLPELEAPIEPMYGALLGGFVWVLGSAGMLVKIDATTYEVREVLDTGVNDARGIVSDGSRLWIVRGLTASLRKFVLSTGAFGDVPMPLAGTSIAFGGGYVWVGGTAGDVYRVDPVSAAVTTTSSLTTDQVYAPAYDPGTGLLWFVTYDGFNLTAHRLTASTGVLVPGTISLTGGSPVGGCIQDTTYYVAITQVGGSPSPKLVAVVSIDTVPAAGPDTTLGTNARALSILPDSGLFVASGVLITLSDDDSMVRVTFPGFAGAASSYAGRLGYVPIVIPPAPTPVHTLIVAVTNVNFGASPYTVTLTDQTIAVDASGGAVFVLLPPTVPIGTTIDVCDKLGSAGTNKITVGGIPFSGITIDGLSSYEINTNYGSVTVRYLGGVSWKVV